MPDTTDPAASATAARARLLTAARPRLDDLRRLHAAVDSAARGLADHYGARLACRRGCTGCCVDELTVFTVEAARIIDEFPDVVAEEAAAPSGGCAFLSEHGDCRVYAARPYVCRTQGLPLRWFEEADDDEVIERRDVCELSSAAVDPVQESPDTCWLIGPYEDALWRLQAHVDEGKRIALRELFGRDARDGGADAEAGK
ncbi:MAG: YkgJ family cysteine cluster protein [Myxococcales bacterium]|nr:YkgJ family cysteine cluster protein [Myxococcales bacterium]MCB9520151.1 YkgJ family cysteine cluster protein [Myxococcales bacterium]MCB9531227.1 YkgJ family cysteine cluster protein [Myxococcales bacterium]MCB9534304.1 YkgJ family cysteine cluster protein [Myxococcales bacterium]